MQTKLTLRLDARLVETAKAYARDHGKSVSQVVADYFTALDHASAVNETGASVPLAPVTQSLVGILRDVDVDQADYRSYLEQKYL
ncbi:MAG: hypothetical protein KDE24_31255 [Caldilinea sp.]|nr:hypothetical protein [Caldilinea sp.]